jgi:hypothetical protein
MQEPNSKLVVLYQKMADLTAPECANTCRAPHSCCDELYCAMTTDYAMERYGIALEPAPPCEANPKHLPYIGPQGCIVAPHLRPLCTMHTCQVNGLGFKLGDEKWTRKYFKLRNAIDRLEND